VKIHVNFLIHCITAQKKTKKRGMTTRWNCKSKFSSFFVLENRNEFGSWLNPWLP
jgi:hypothetical protein